MLSLNDQQQRAVDHGEGPLLVLAGAGAGKTRVVTARILRLLEKGVPSTAIVAVTFTNKAAGEMQERVAHLSARRPLISTFHSLGVRILRQSIAELGYKPDFTIYDEEDSNRLLKVCLTELGIAGRDAEPKLYKGLISDAKNRLLAPEQIDPNALETRREQRFPEIYSLYQTKLKQYNALDFDDLLYVTARLFRECPQVLRTYQERWHYFLIDEYQDINHAQYEIAAALVASSSNLFVVGDPDQSIYSWRGANIQNILNFERDFPGARVVKLEQNYRSSNTVLEASNALIRRNVGRYEKNLWSNRGAGNPIIVVTCDSDRDEARFVAEKIAEHIESGSSLNEIVVFYRTNFQSRQFEDALLAHRVPYAIIGGMSFYQRREIKDILAFLRMVESGTDFLAFARTLNIPKRGIGEATLDKLRRGALERQLPVFDYCCREELDLPKRQREGVANYVQLIADLRALKAKGVPLFELVAQAVRLSGYLNHLKGDEETFQDRKENVDELIAKAAEWSEGTENPTLLGFLEELSLKSTLDEAPFGQRVRLMTLHNGKGLEFEVVFLVGMEESLFPHANSMGNQAAVEEERRLCYVGMTRTKDLLYLSSSGYRFLWGEPQLMRPSRFLSEIPSQYVRKIRHKSF
jgi:DNA helicase II / ATP-dependent DNA helicase PcrA